MAQPSRTGLAAGAAPPGPRRLSRSVSVFVADSATIALGFGGTAVTGFAFWWLAAHTMPASTVGLASAAVATVGFVALAAELGLGPLLIGEVSRRRADSTSLIAASLAASAVVALVAGSLVLGAALAVAPDGIRTAATDPVLAAAFLTGCVLTTLSSVLDQALIGLLRSRLQMARALAFGLFRLVPLGLLTAAGIGGGAGMLLGSWLFGLAVPLAAALVLAGPAATRMPRLALLRPLVGRAGAHHLMTAAIQAPGLALPVVAATLLGTEIAAPFYAALMVLAALSILPASLATRLVVGDDAPAEFARRLRLSLGLSFACAALAATLFATASGTLLALLGPTYPALAGDGLRLLGFALFGSVIKFHLLAIARRRGRLLSGGLVLGAGAVLEIGFAAIGAVMGGLGGTVGGWLVGFALQAVFLGPTILREATVALAPPRRMAP